MIDQIISQKSNNNNKSEGTNHQQDLESKGTQFTVYTVSFDGVFIFTYFPTVRVWRSRFCSKFCS